MIVRTEINSAAEAARDFRVPAQTQTPIEQPVRPAANSIEGLRQMGLIAQGKRDDVERTVIFPRGGEITIRVKPVTRVVRDIATQSTTVFTAFYPEHSTLRDIYKEFCQE